MRLRTIPIGFETSVASIGSQTANTRTLRSGLSLKIFSTAEAPCRQVGHVGDNRRMIRCWLEA